MNRQAVSCIFLGLSMLLTLGRAADPTGTISGTVLDSSNAPIPKARVIVTNTATGLNRETLTASDGGFVFPLIPVGPYRVTAETAGFRRFEQRQVTITTDVNVTIQAVLQVGDVAETVTVEARVGLVETRSGIRPDGLNTICESMRVHDCSIRYAIEEKPWGCPVVGDSQEMELRTVNSCVARPDVGYVQFAEFLLVGSSEAELDAPIVHA